MCQRNLSIFIERLTIKKIGKDFWDMLYLDNTSYLNGPFLYNDSLYLNGKDFWDMQYLDNTSYLNGWMTIDQKLVWIENHNGSRVFF